MVHHSGLSDLEDHVGDDFDTGCSNADRSYWVMKMGGLQAPRVKWREHVSGKHVGSFADLRVPHSPHCHQHRWLHAQEIDAKKKAEPSDGIRGNILQILALPSKTCGLERA